MLHMHRDGTITEGGVIYRPTGEEREVEYNGGFRYFRKYDGFFIETGNKLPFSFWNDGFIGYMLCKSV